MHQVIDKDGNLLFEACLHDPKEFPIYLNLKIQDLNIEEFDDVLRAMLDIRVAYERKTQGQQE